jgi:hypothetical protein
MRGIRLLGLLSRRRPAGQKIQSIFGGGAGFSGIHHKCQAWIGWQVHRLESQMNVPDDRVVDVLESGAVKRTLWEAQRVRNSSLRVESSPTRSINPRSYGFRPASDRRIATVSFAVLCQLRKYVRARGLRNTNSGDVHRANGVDVQV